MRLINHIRHTSLEHEDHMIWRYFPNSLQWRHDKRDGVSNHRRLDCLYNRLFRQRSKKTSKLRVTGLCEGNSLVTGEFPIQKPSNAENVSISWRHHAPVLSEGNQPFPVYFPHKWPALWTFYFLFPWIYWWTNGWMAVVWEDKTFNMTFLNC